MASAAFEKLVSPEDYSFSGTDEEAAFLREDIVQAWTEFQSGLAGDQKELLRKMHLDAKISAGGIDPHRLIKLLNKHSSYFKLGSVIDPKKIQPKLILVEPKSKWEDIFKICRAFWTMPYSKGYGRRLRFVVFDEHHQSVIGIIGLQSPPADLAIRDQLFNFPKERKLDYVNAMLDAYTIGAIPPYSQILGGKLVASIVASEEVRQAYWKVYAGKRTLLENKMLAQPLLAVTTTSAFGRSSIYNRLKFEGRFIAEPIGWTKGFGTVHLENIYPRIEAWLKARGEFVPGGYGHGPKVRWQNITIALSRLGLPSQYAMHGLKREVFLFRHVSNIEDVVKNAETLPHPIPCKLSDLSEYWRARWAIPRSIRDDSWKYSVPIDSLMATILAMQKNSPET